MGGTKKRISASKKGYGPLFEFDGGEENRRSIRKLLQLGRGYNAAREMMKAGREGREKEGRSAKWLRQAAKGPGTTV